MTRLRHTAGRGHKGPADGKHRPFRLFAGMRERSYERTVRKIESADARLEALCEKRKAFEMLSKSSQASVVNEDESNWDEAMSNARACDSGRKTLKAELRIAGFALFSQTMFNVALFGGVPLIMLHFAVPGMSPLMAGAIGALFAIGALMRTWSQVTTGSQEFLDLVSASLNEQKSSLDAERLRLIRKLHGWKSSGE
ncbi:hypothetical protein L0Y65_06355 [Candidatus Micrarchaeota archaeon]|nr:hypothetical protein [Candidatus Micrarchaeota archaeon]